MNIKSALTALIIFISPHLHAARFTSISADYTNSFLGSSTGWAISVDGYTVVGYLNVGREVVITPPGRPSFTTIQYTQTAYKWNPYTSSITLLPFANATGSSYDGSVIVGERYRWTESGGRKI